jgi:ABC transporter DrrB family efflux protein
MSAITTGLKSPAVEPGFFKRLQWEITDALTLVKRNLLHIPRTPELLLDVTVQPIMFVLLFRYVFGGAIKVENGSYVNFLMAGIFVQTLVFVAVTTGIAIANDLQKGLIDRFRSLPMSRAAVLVAQTLTDLLRGALAILIMFVCGLATGFRPEGSPLRWLLALAVVFFFSFSISWIGVLVGLAARSPEAVQGMMFVVIFPLTFASSAFVPTDSMPHWLRVFAENQPVSVVIDQLRRAFLDQPLNSSTWTSLLWSIGSVIIFFPAAVWMYRERTK